MTIFDNTTAFGLMDKALQDEMKAWKGGYLLYTASGAWVESIPSWYKDGIYRAKPEVQAMSKLPKEYCRCKDCKELIAVHYADCPNCANRNKLAGYIPVRHGQSGRPTLDIQEGNWE